MEVVPYRWQLYSTKGEPDEIHAWSLNKKNEPVLVRVVNFRPSIYLELPRLVDDHPYRWDQESLDAANTFIDKLLRRRIQYPCLCKVVHKYPIYYYHNKTKPYIQCSFKSFTDLYKAVSIFKEAVHIEDIGSVKITPLEQDISSVQQFLRSKDLQYAQLFSFPMNKPELGETLSKLDHEYIVTPSDITPQKEPFITSPKVAAFDIETYTPNHDAFPEKTYAPCVCYLISIIVGRLGSNDWKKYAIYIGEISDEGMMRVTNSTPYEAKAESELKGHSEDTTIITCEDEPELLLKFCELLEELDPDIITGFNIIGFDWSYLAARFKVNALDFPQMGRLHGVIPTVFSKTWGSAAFGTNTQEFLDISGRLNVDLLPVIKRDNKLDKNDLDYVSKKFLGKGKHEVSAKEMFRLYKNYMDTRSPSSIREMTKVINYCIQDSMLCIELMVKLKTWISLIQMANVASVNIIDLFCAGQQIRFFNLLSRACLQKGYVINHRVLENIIPFSGGFVGDPIPGLYDNVLCFDFNSLYPNEIISNNICFTTLLQESDTSIEDKDCNISEGDVEVTEEKGISAEAFDQMEGYDEKEEEEEDTEEKETKEKKIEVKVIHYRDRFVKAHVREGILPIVLRWLLSRRDEVKQEIKKTLALRKAEAKKEKPDQELLDYYDLQLDILDKYQLALKITANSCFGALGVKNGKLPLVEGARFTCANGRRDIGIVNEYLRRDYNGKIIYNDTDSSMVSIGIKDSKDCAKYGMKIAMEISGYKKGDTLWDGSIAEADKPGMFPPPMKILYEKGMRMLAIKKKRYAYLPVEADGSFKRDDEGKLVIEKKGIVGARREHSKFLKNTYAEILEKILMRQPLMEVVNTIVNKIDDLVNDRIPINQLLMIKELGVYSSKCTYFLKTYMDRVAREGRPVKAGDRVEYLIIVNPDSDKTGDKMLSIERYNELTSKPLIDKEYYLLGQLQTQIDQLFTVAYKKHINLLTMMDSEQGYYPTGRHHPLKIWQKDPKLKTYTFPIIRMIHAMYRDGFDVKTYAPWCQALFSSVIQLKA